MRPPQLYIDTLGLAVQTYAIAYAEGGSRLYSSAEYPDRFSWSSSTPSVVSVDETGSVTSASWGTAIITANSQGVTGAIWINVRDAVHLAWSVAIDNESMRAGIAIGHDGTIYVGSRTRLYAISPLGGVLWTFMIASGFLGTPAVGDDGTLYLGSSPGGLTAVGQGGAIRWVRPEVGRISSSPALGPDGTIYVASGDSLVYAVDPQGNIQWDYRGTSHFWLSSPAVASDGTIYIGGSDGILHAINADGSRRWTFQADDQIQSSPSIGMDGTIYFGSHDQRLYAVSPEGTERWRTASLGATIYSSPSIGPDGTIYVGAAGVFAIDSNGSVRWSYVPHTGGGISTTPILGADGTVYVTSGSPSALVVYAFDAQGRLQWDYSAGDYTGAGLSASAAIGVDGTIFAASSNGTVHALVETAPANGGFAGAPWPQARGNRANTGRAGG